jgi:hypothetical protein
MRIDFLACLAIGAMCLCRNVPAEIFTYLDEDGTLILTDTPRGSARTSQVRSSGMTAPPADLVAKERPPGTSLPTENADDQRLQYEEMYERALLEVDD